MVNLKKYMKKKTVKRKSRRIKKRTGTLTIGPYQRLNTRPKVYRFKRSGIDLTTMTMLTASGQYTYNSPIIPYSAGAPTQLYGQMGFAFNDIPGVNNFNTFFQRARLDKVKVTFRFNLLPSNSTLMTSLLAAKFETTSLQPLTVSFMSQLQNLVKYQFSNEHRECSITIKPRLIGFCNVNNGSNAVSYINNDVIYPRNTWVDLVDDYATSKYPVYSGIAFLLDNLGNNTVDGFVCDIEYSMSAIALW